MNGSWLCGDDIHLEKQRTALSGVRGRREVAAVQSHAVDDRCKIRIGPAFPGIEWMLREVQRGVDFLYAIRALPAHLQVTRAGALLVQHFEVILLSTHECERHGRAIGQARPTEKRRAAESFLRHPRRVGRDVIGAEP